MNCYNFNDFRKLAGIECYSPVDNVSELTARTNDEGWHTIFKSWLIISKLNKNEQKCTKQWRFNKTLNSPL